MMKGGVRRLLLAVVLIGGSLNAFADGLGDNLGLSPYWNWQTIESDHFRVTFPVELRSPARRSLKYLELAHRTLGPIFNWEPRTKIQVLLIDNADAANGMALANLRFGIVLYLSTPENWGSIYSYDDWLKILTFHEYVHILQTDSTRGVWDLLRYVFGDVLLPNSTWPRWLLEGMAVYFETRLTRGGRGRSTYWDGIVRAAVDEGVLGDSSFMPLDRLGGTNPYFPGGQSYYLFGYHLVNQVQKDADQKSQGEVLGKLTYEAAARVPYFINGNVENVSGGKDYYQYWSEWVREARKRAKRQLAKIKSQPLSHAKLLTRPQEEVFGTAASPDGKYLAYSQVSGHERSGLFLRELKTGRVQKVMDKFWGVGMDFTPDSQALVFSAGDREGQFYLYSDLYVYDRKRSDLYALTDGARAKDPHISSDGKWLVYTKSRAAIVRVIRAPLIFEDGQYRLGKEEVIYKGRRYDQLSQPKFDPSGKRVFFSLHRNGSMSEEIVSIELGRKLLKIRVKDGSFNRFVTFDSNGEWYYVSNRTGVANVYHSSGRQITNVKTSLWLPTFVRGRSGDRLYGSLLRHDGWALAQVQSIRRVNTDRVRLEPLHGAGKKGYGVRPPELTQADLDQNVKMKPYSVFPSIWPRAWSPIFGLSANQVVAGGLISGYDATDRHRYFLSGVYDSATQNVDWLGFYGNRMLGPTLSAQVSEQTTSIANSSVGGYDYIRKFSSSASVSFPFRWRFSTLTPSLSYNAEREFRFIPAQQSDPVSKSGYLPSADVAVTFNNTFQSNLGVGPELGHVLRLGARRYFDFGFENTKFLFRDVSYFRVTDHAVLSPQVNAAYVSRRSSRFTSANVVTEGRSLCGVSCQLGRVLNQSGSATLPSANFDEVTIRGYPGTLFTSRAVVNTALDFRFPIARIFRGWGTRPVFLNNLYGFAFAEGTFFPSQGGSRSVTLPSAGGGLRLTSNFFVHVPVILSLEYHHGFREEFGGQGELFGEVGVGAISF